MISTVTPKALCAKKTPGQLRSVAPRPVRLNVTAFKNDKDNQLSKAQEKGEPSTEKPMLRRDSVVPALPSVSRLNQFMQEMQREMDMLTSGDGFLSEFMQPFNMFSQVAAAPAGGFRLATDITEDDKHYYITADVPGVPKEDITVEVDNSKVLHISAEKKQEQKKEFEGGYRFERSFGRYYRSFQLPEGVDASNIVAETNNGVLKLTLPKLDIPKPSPKKIEIK